MAPQLRPLNPADNHATRPNDRRDYRVFWAHERRDRSKDDEGRPVKWSGGERRARKRFARLIAGGKMSKTEALADALQVFDPDRPPPPSWTADEWKKHWSTNRLRLIADRWLLHPYVQEEAKRQKKIASAQAALRAGLPDDVLAEIAQNTEYSPRDRAMAAMGLAKLSQRHSTGQLVDLAAEARKARDVQDKQAEEDDGTPAA